MNLFHGIQGGYACIPYGIQWNPCEFHMGLITPWPFHHHSTWNPRCPWNKKLAGVSANIDSMDSIWNNPGKVKTSGLYTPTAFPSRLCWTEGKQNPYFFAFSPQYFSNDFPVLVQAFLVRPQSPMDFQWTNSKPTPEPMEVQWICDRHSQRKSNRSLMDCKQAGLVISIINEKVINNN